MFIGRHYERSPRLLQQNLMEVGPTLLPVILNQANKYCQYQLSVYMYNQLGTISFHTEFSAKSLKAGMFFKTPTSIFFIKFQMVRPVATTGATFSVFFGCHIVLVTVRPQSAKFIVADRSLRSHGHYIVFFYGYYILIFAYTWNLDIHTSAKIYLQISFLNKHNNSEL